jgi:predicted esterase YcpF (UPF0227 family)
LKQLFYFNGFNTAIPDDIGVNAKISAVADYCMRADYEFNPTTIDYRKVFEHRDTVLSRVNPAADEVVLCGTSMGGWFARILQLSLAASGFTGGIATLAFNPAFNIGVNTDRFLGRWENFVTFEPYEWTAVHGDQLRQFEAAVDYDAAGAFYIYCDKDDEVIDWQVSAARHAGISKFLAFEGGCHSFEHFREALEDFDCHHRAGDGP